MSEAISTWPDKIQARTQAEWDEVIKNWQNNANRQMVLDALKLLKIPAMTYARINDPKERVALITKEQGRLLGEESLSGGKAETKKAATPKAGTGTPSTGGGGGGAAGGAVANAQLIAKLDALSSDVTELKQILKILLIQNPDALSLCADQDTVNEIGGKSLPELAGNG